MTQHIDLDLELENWLAEGPSQLPDRAIDGIVRQLDQTKQRKHWWFPRKGTMTRSILSVGGVAAAFLIAVVGFAYFSGRPGPNVGGAPTPSPTPSPVALPADGTVVEPGSYAVTIDGYGYTFWVPKAGWKATVVTLAEAQSDDRPNRADVELTHGDASNEPPDLAGFALWGNVLYVHQVDPPCSQLFGFSEVGPSADDLATAIASIEGWRSSEPVDVTVGRYSGKRLQLTVPGRDKFDSCPQGGIQSFSDENEKARVYEGPEQVDDIWILDLDNGDRQLFLITYFPTTPAERVDELRQIVESVEISPADGTQGAAPD